MYHFGQVVGIELYRNDVVVKRQGKAPQVHDQTRMEVKEFSKASRKRLAFVASNTPITFTTLITLTYPGEFSSDGDKCRRDRRAFLDWLRRETGGCEYLWFLEFQQRGAPHLHVLTDALWPRTRDSVTALRFRVSTTWYRIVGSGDTRHLAAGCRTEKLRSARGGTHYAVKYAQKMRQKVVPEGYTNVGRFWGHSRKVKPEAPTLIHCTEDDVRGVLDGWPYAMPDNCHVYRTLYNTREIFDAFLELDPTASNDTR